MVERAGRIVRRKVETTAVAGIPVVSTVTEEFDFKTYPEVVRRSLLKSTVPQPLYADALAVVGRAYSNVMASWTPETIGDTPDLAWRVPAPKDFEACVDNLRDKVGVEELVVLSDRLFGRADTVPEIFASMENELQLIFNPVEEEV